MDTVSMWLPLCALILVAALHRWTFASLFERYFALSLTDAPARALLFFGAWSVIFIALFPREVHELFGEIAFIGYLALLFFFFVVFPWVFRFLRARMKEAPWLSKLYPTEGMLSLEERYIVAKVGDVFVQQLIAGIMLIMLIDAGLSYPALVLTFVAVFGLAHLYLFATSGPLWGLYYSIFGFTGAFAIPFFIVFVPAGIWYTLLFHMLLYVLFGIFFGNLSATSPISLRDISHKASSL